MYHFILSLLLSTLLYSQTQKYLDNHSCQECHEKIYDEYLSSAHSQSYFTNELHRKISQRADPDSYKCAVCHMPMANNLPKLISGEAKPDKNNKTHSDGVSCFFCHTIAYVKEAHKFNINTKSRQAKGFKPTLYGLLDDAEDSDKHSSVKNPVYAKKVCTGCHSHKLNDNNVTIFRAMKPHQESQSCISCHMPEIDGGVEKLNKRSRLHHASHKFLGIHDPNFRTKGVDINITTAPNKLIVTLINKMQHPLIIQPARVKYIKIEIISDKKTIWQNYKKSPKEDKQGYFSTIFSIGKQLITIPANATTAKINNLDAKEIRNLEYKTPELSKGDRVKITLFAILAKPECLSVVELEDENITKPIEIKSVEVVL